MNPQRDRGHLIPVQPAHFARPRGYANGMITTGRTLYVAGQVGWESDQTFASTDFIAQFARALDNVLAVVSAAGGQPDDIAQMTVYVTDIAAYRSSERALGAIWRERMGRHFPAMALLGVSALVHPEAVVEIQAVACLPTGSPQPGDPGNPGNHDPGIAP